MPVSLPGSYGGRRAPAPLKRTSVRGSPDHDLQGGANCSSRKECGRTPKPPHEVLLPHPERRPFRLRSVPWKGSLERDSSMATWTAPRIEGWPVVERQGLRSRAGNRTTEKAHLNALSPRSRCD